MAPIASGAARTHAIKATMVKARMMADERAFEVRTKIVEESMKRQKRQ